MSQTTFRWVDLFPNSFVVYHPFRLYFSIKKIRCSFFPHFNNTLYRFSSYSCSLSLLFFLSFWRYLGFILYALLYFFIYSLSLLHLVHIWWLLISSFAQKEKYQMENVPAKIDWVSAKRGDDAFCFIIFTDSMRTTKSIKQKIERERQLQNLLNREGERKRDTESEWEKYVNSAVYMVHCAHR